MTSLVLNNQALGLIFFFFEQKIFFQDSRFDFFVLDSRCIGKLNKKKENFSSDSYEIDINHLLLFTAF